MTARAGRVRELEARNKELEERLARAEKTARALQEVGIALGSILDLDQLLSLILKKIAELLEADRATLYLLDEHRERLLSRIMIGSEARSIELAVGVGIAGHVAKVGRTVRVKDAYRDRRFDRAWDELYGYRTRSILAAPMKNHIGRTIGVVQVLNKRVAEEFSQHDEELLEALATQAAISIDNSRLFLSVIQKNMQLVETKEQLEHRVSDLKLLFELESAMGRATTMEDLAAAVLTEAARACEARAGVLLVDEAESGMFLYVVEPVDGEPEAEDLDVQDKAALRHQSEVKRLPAKRGEGLIGWVMTHGESIILAGGAELNAPSVEGTDVARPDLSESRLTQALPQVETAIVVPMAGEDETPIGAVALCNSKQPAGFTQDHRALLRLVSANASTALRLFRSRIEHERTERLTSIGRLLSGVMHDMRTPLTVISGYVQLMATAPDQATREDHARLILKQFDAISAMQREVLEFARGERSILLRKVYLTKFFGDLEKQLMAEIEGNNVLLRIDLDDRGTARFDEAKMTRVLHNLIRNAVEAMQPEGGTVTIRAYRDGPDLMLSVADTGKGIPQEIRTRLFKAFTTAGKRGGTGLGLAIVKKIMDEHGGTIEVDSTDKGAKFTLRLPQDAPASRLPAPSTQAGSASSQPTGRGKAGGGAPPERGKPPQGTQSDRGRRSSSTES
ncbi:sensor histidine kinase [Chondromyces apiculatus]|uniref:histidine kinase n=1 Tax=Chondromyces apiculatus DSM 436 TaxID=1192034 RepID=A0A017TBQ1_9BACT|nr:GAF domain-containing sensor histidine kinase [Chondromyces apiculatus]EYF06713.1 Adenylate cyclase [Chondromyces apiculatus DSM 436]